MKFFTLSWWAKEEHRDEEPQKAYQKHLDNIKKDLPVDLVLLEEKMPLHDARLRKTELNLGKKELTLIVEGGDEDGNWTQYQLCYGSVQSFETNSDPDQGLGGPYGYGDIGYDEVDLLGGVIEHRILFSSGIEFIIQFKSFSLKSEHMKS